jgi:2-oxoglutarate/2-oxoacid ferredoxin oxidoreductase subunit beta
MSEPRKLYGRPKNLVNLPFSYCPGCSHGVLHRLIAQAIDDLDINERSIGICSAGCSVRMWRYFTCDMTQALHGRGPALATGLKRALPDRVVWAYQGDGDIAGIGIAHIIHAAARGEKFTVFFLNNGFYGATGGQLAPTTLLGENTSTTPDGREQNRDGAPIRVAELLSHLDMPAYIERVAVTDPVNIRKAAKAVRRAFETQLSGEAFSLVEVMGICPINLHMDPSEAARHQKESFAHMPLGIIKEPAGVSL